MKLSIFANDLYKLLYYMHSIEIEYKDRKIIFDSQKEISNNIHFSLTKTNNLINELEKLGLLEKYSGKGKYYITSLGYKLLTLMDREI